MKKTLEIKRIYPAQVFKVVAFTSLPLLLVALILMVVKLMSISGAIVPSEMTSLIPLLLWALLPIAYGIVAAIGAVFYNIATVKFVGGIKVETENLSESA